MNLDVGRVVYEKNKDEQIAPASLVKIMSSILVLEAEANLEKTVEAPRSIFDEFFGNDVSNAGIVAGEQVMVTDLLHAMLMQSACEAASILAYEYGGGSIETFVSKMNAKVKALGANHTVFKNPHGLDADGQVTTAYDIYLIVSYALKLPMFEKIATTVRYELSPTNKHSEKRWILHTNIMLDPVRGGAIYYPDMYGLKTGTTAMAGKNMITMLRKNGYTYLLVTLGAKNDKGTEGLHYQDHKNIYNWVMDTFQVKTVVSAEETIPNEMKVRLSDKKDHMLVVVEKAYVDILPKDIDISNIARKINLPESIDAPVKKGGVLGTMTLTLSGEKLAEINLVAGEDVRQSTMLTILDGIGNILSSPWFMAFVIIAVFAAAVYVFYAASVNKRRRKARWGKGRSLKMGNSMSRNRGNRKRFRF